MPIHDEPTNPPTLDHWRQPPTDPPAHDRHPTDLPIQSQSQTNSPIHKSKVNPGPIDHRPISTSSADPAIHQAANPGSIVIQSDNSLSTRYQSKTNPTIQRDSLTSHIRQATEIIITGSAPIGIDWPCIDRGLPIRYKSKWTIP